MIKIANNVRRLIAFRANQNKSSSSIGTKDTLVDAPIKCTPGFGCKRYFTLEEELEVAEAKHKILPTLFTTRADPISSRLSSPAWSGVGGGALGALLGAGIGAGASALTDSDLLLSSGLGGAIGGLGGGLYGYGKRLLHNKEVVDLMEDLPVGADSGDVEMFSDPKLRAQLARDFQRQLIRKSLGLARH